MRRTSGQVLAEFCLILPLMIVLLVAIVDLGFYLLINISMHTAVREGAQLAMYDNAFTTQQIKDRIKQSAYGATVTDSEIFVDQNSSITVGPSTYKAFNIRVTHQHKLLIPFILSSSQTVPIGSSMKSLIVTGLKP
jgi:Flp pilus assembly protein TadG